jgi:serine/threonine-protein phosphatase 2B catalytic subunit
MSRHAQIEKAIHQIADKSHIPKIDFTQHQLEDGNFISTQERVIKDVRCAMRLPEILLN